MAHRSDDAAVLYRSLGLAAIAIGLLGAIVVATSARRPAPAPVPVAAEAPRVEPPAAVAVPAPRQVPELTPEERRRGHHECNPPDRVGLGPYRPYVKTSQGRLAIPQRGGATPDHGYDVLIHFHGADPARKTVVQAARGVAYVAIDKGLGSGPYSDAFVTPDVWRTLKQSIAAELRRHTGEPEAHIRHIALSSWSAGYGAIVQILKQDPDAIDAVVLLDSLHASYRYGTDARARGKLAAVDTGTIAPVIAYARRALAGEKLLVLTHSRVDPVTYPSVGLSADALLRDLGVERRPAAGRSGMLEQVSAVDVRGLHVWEYSGRDEMTHCAHLSLITRALGEVVEATWQTPELDRSVPATPPPLLGGGPAGSANATAPLLELIPAAPSASAAPPNRDGAKVEPRAASSGTAKD